MKLICRIRGLVSRFIVFIMQVYYGDKFRVGKISIRDGIKIWLERDASLSIGDGCFFNSGCCITCMYNIEIGNNCLFGEGVKIYDHNHKFRNKGMLIKEQGFSCGKVCIGDNCWLGSNVVILKNARIGNNVVVGAGCVINGNIPDNTIVRVCNCCMSYDNIKYG